MARKIRSLRKPYDMKKSRQRTTGVALSVTLSLTMVQATTQPTQAVEIAPPSNHWVPPLEPPIRLINHYRQPNSDYSSGHRGVDYLVQEDQVVLAPENGEVWFSGKVVNRNLLSIMHHTGYLTEFEPVCTDLSKGEKVFAGQEIGRVCKADTDYRQHCSTAICLHFSLRKTGSYLSPLFLIGGLNPSRLIAEDG